MWPCRLIHLRLRRFDCHRLQEKPIHHLRSQGGTCCPQRVGKMRLHALPFSPRLLGNSRVASRVPSEVTIYQSPLAIMASAEAAVSGRVAGLAECSASLSESVWPLPSL